MVGKRHNLLSSTDVNISLCVKCQPTAESVNAVLLAERCSVVTVGVLLPNLIPSTFAASSFHVCVCTINIVTCGKCTVIVSGIFHITFRN